MATDLAFENGDEETSFVDLLTRRQDHFHLVMAAQSATMVKVYGTQLFHTDYLRNKERNC